MICWRYAPWSDVSLKSVGWECPVCHKGNGPTTTHCWHCALNEGSDGWKEYKRLLEEEDLLPRKERRGLSVRLCKDERRNNDIENLR